MASSSIDPTSDPLDKSLLPLGESVEDIVKLAMVVVTDAEHSSVLGGGVFGDTCIA